MRTGYAIILSGLVKASTHLRSARSTEDDTFAEEHNSSKKARVSSPVVVIGIDESPRDIDEGDSSEKHKEAATGKDSEVASSPSLVRQVLPHDIRGVIDAASVMSTGKIDAVPTRLSTLVTSPSWECSVHSDGGGIIECNSATIQQSRHATIHVGAYRSSGRHLPRDVVVKRSITMESIPSFLNEIRVLRVLGQPSNLTGFSSIGHLIDSSTSSYLPMIVLDHLGKDMQDFVNDSDSFLNHNQLIRIAIDVSNALNFAESHGYSHCDVKPENICLKSAVPFSLCLIDWGSARPIGDTRTDMVGSYPYAAPEVHLRLQRSHCQADMWSLGVTLCCLQTRGANNLLEQFRRHHESDRTSHPHVDFVNAMQKITQTGIPNAMITASRLNHLEKIDVFEIDEAARRPPTYLEDSTHADDPLQHLNDLISKELLVWDPRGRATSNRVVSRLLDLRRLD